jgi:hypothetical protein
MNIENLSGRCQPALNAICGALWNSVLCQSTEPELDDELPVENVVDRLRRLSAARRDISAKLEFIASYFRDLLCRPDALNNSSFSKISEILSDGPLRLESEHNLHDFMSKAIERTGKCFISWT